MKLYEFTKSYELFDEAQKYVPGGIYGPRTPRFLTFGSYPAFLKHGKGCRVWDVDGNEYIDYMCSFGTNLLGLKNPRVEKAVRRQMKNADCFTLPSDLWVPLAKKMTETVHNGDWCVFGKNGSDVTSYAISVARVATGRWGIILAKGSYHGSHFWCQPHGAGVPEEWKAHIHYIDYNNPASLKSVVEANRGKIAAIMLTPHRHDAFIDQELPAKGFVDTVNSLAKSEGFKVIIDDVRCGFRLHLAGSAKWYGYDADLQCFGKAMANGYPIAVAMGKGGLMEAAAKVYFTGTHFFSGVPFAAALAAIEENRASGAIETIDAMGRKLMTGLADAAASGGMRVILSGPPAMPYMNFDNDANHEKNRYFCGEAARRGIFFHPHHNWFVCAAVTDRDIRKTLDVSAECFKLTKVKFGG